MSEQMVPAGILAADSGGDSGWLYLIAFVLVAVFMWAKNAPKREQERAHARRRLENRTATNKKLGTDPGRIVRYPSGVYLDKVETNFNYLGGNPVRPNAVSGVCLLLADELFAVEAMDGTLLFTVQHADLVSVDVSTEQEIQERVTAKRLILTGVIAFAWKKRSGGSVLVVVSTRDSGEFVIEATGRSKSQVMALLAPLMAAVPPRAGKDSATSGSGPMRSDGPRNTSEGGDRSNSGEGPGTDSSDADRVTDPAVIEDRLNQIQDLLDRGVITETEYLDIRKRTLDEL